MPYEVKNFEGSLWIPEKKKDTSCHTMKKEALEMVKVYAKWAERYPDKVTDAITIKVYWPLLKDVITRR